MFKGHWTLGVILADNGETSAKQILPLASSRFTFSSNHSVLFDKEFSQELINIDGFSFLPFNEFTLPVPTITMQGKGAAIINIGKDKDDEIPAVEIKTSVDGDKNIVIRVDPPYIHVNKNINFEESDLTSIYSEYDISLGVEEKVFDIEQISSMTLSLTMKNDPDKNFPIRLKLSTADGNDYFPN